MSKNKFLKLDFKSEFMVVNAIKKRIKEKLKTLEDKKEYGLYLANVMEITNNHDYLYYMITEFSNDFKDWVYSCKDRKEVEENLEEYINNTRNRIMVIAGVLVHLDYTDMEVTDQDVYCMYCDISVGVFLESLVDIIFILKRDKKWYDFRDREKYCFFSNLDEFYSMDYPFDNCYGVLEVVLESIMGDENTCILAKKKGMELVELKEEDKEGE